MDMKVPRERLLSAQRSEISEGQTYARLARNMRDGRNREVLERLAREEMGHYGILKSLTQTDVKPCRLRVWWYLLISRVLGISFGLHLMERGEKLAQDLYGRLKEEVPELAAPFLDEQRHETELLGMIREERIEYAGSVVLGLNDALMELTGALVGLTLAFSNGRIIAMTGFIIGVAASISMAASEFLSSREESGGHRPKSPLKAAAYTGCAYIVTVLALISPYLLIRPVYAAMAVMMAASILIIWSYNFYIATAKGLRVWPRFAQMAVISLGVAAVSLLVGMAARRIFGVEA